MMKKTILNKIKPFSIMSLLWVKGSISSQQAIRQLEYYEMNYFIVYITGQQRWGSRSRIRDKGSDALLNPGSRIQIRYGKKTQIWDLG
jgi:hypothetical protein